MSMSELPGEFNILRLDDTPKIWRRPGPAQTDSAFRKHYDVVVIMDWLVGCCETPGLAMSPDEIEVEGPWRSVGEGKGLRCSRENDGSGCDHTHNI